MDIIEKLKAVEFNPETAEREEIDNWFNEFEGYSIIDGNPFMDTDRMRDRCLEKQKEYRKDLKVLGELL